MKVYVDGADNIGWHVDVERQHLQDTLRRIGIREVPDPLKADIVHNVWWDSFILNRTRLERVLLRFKRNTIVTASNFVNIDDPKYDRRSLFNVIKKYARAWVAPSLKQKRLFDKQGIACFYQPFFLDLRLFYPLRDEISKDDLAHEFGIPKEIYKNRVMIGSYQRDSEGKDLKRPKWQKDPDLLIDILRDLPKHAFVLLLAGPRRHYVISKCKEHSIPYWYVGTETTDDDLRHNAVDVLLMPKLYALLDLYLVTSRSEGGPKAVMEATATRTPIMSTNVGIAEDFLDRHNVFDDTDDYKKAVHDFVLHNKADIHTARVEEQYKICKNILGQDAMDRRLKDIYANVRKIKAVFT